MKDSTKDTLIGLAIGMVLATIVLFGFYHNARIKRLEIQQSQIVNALTQPRQVAQVQPAPKLQPKTKAKPVE